MTPIVSGVVDIVVPLVDHGAGLVWADCRHAHVPGNLADLVVRLDLGRATSAPDLPLLADRLRAAERVQVAATIPAVMAAAVSVLERAFSAPPVTVSAFEPGWDAPVVEKVA